MRRGVTLVELIFVVVIVAALSVAAFKALSVLVVRSFKAKELTRLSLESQIAINQISSYLQDRIPASVIGYDIDSGDYEYIGEINQDNKYEVVEWLVRARRDFEAGKFSGFCDIRASLNNSGYKVVTPMLELNGGEYNLIFAGSFDMADSDILDYKNAFGWHSGGSKNSFDITFDANNDIIEITDTDKPKRIYEKFFLTTGAYALARGEDIDQQSSCIKDLNVSAKDINDTLFLFYGYRPWKGETFCADIADTTSTKSAKAAVLAKNVSGFVIKEQDYTLRVILDINKSIRGSTPIHFTKMKVVF